MQYTIKLFAMLRDARRAESLTIELPEGATADGLKPAIALAYPELAPHLGAGVRVAAGLRFVAPDHRLRPDEELALVPPVSGG